MPRPVLLKLNAEINSHHQAPDVNERFPAGAIPHGNTSRSSRRFSTASARNGDRWRRRLGLRPMTTSAVMGHASAEPLAIPPSDVMTHGTHDGKQASSILIGIDTGGTFTDLVAVDAARGAITITASRRSPPIPRRASSTVSPSCSTRTGCGAAT
jgi:hypothetical protein